MGTKKNYLPIISERHTSIGDCELMFGGYMVEEKKSLGDFLIGLGIITADQLKKASQEQKQKG